MNSNSHYRFIEHGGDIEIEVYGKGFNELFSNCIESTADIIVPVKDLDCETRIRNEYAFTDSPNLLVQVLTDIIGEFEVSDTLYFMGESIDINDGMATISLCGHKFETAPDAMTVLKAVTYHNLLFDPDAGIARITFDI